MEELLRYSFDTLRNVPLAFRMRMLAIRVQARLSVLEERWRNGEAAQTFDVRQVISDLKAACTAFLHSETCSVIASAQNLTLFNKAFKPSFCVGDTELWYNPGLIWREGKQLVSLRIHFAKPSAEFIRAESDMFALSAWEHTRTDETLSLFRYYADGEWKETQYKGSCSSGERRIQTDLLEMKALISGEMVNLFDFPAETDDRCSSCRFAAVCAALTEQFGDV